MLHEKGLNNLLKTNGGVVPIAELMILFWLSTTWNLKNMVEVVAEETLYLPVDAVIPIKDLSWIGVFGTNNKCSFLKLEKTEFWNGWNQDQWRILNYGM